MKAIQTRYLGPTNVRGSRIKAFAEGGNQLTVSYDHDSDNPHRDAAVALCKKLGWAGTLAEGGLPNGDCVFVFCDATSCLTAVSPKYPQPRHPHVPAMASPQAESKP